MADIYDTINNLRRIDEAIEAIKKHYTEVRSYYDRRFNDGLDVAISAIKNETSPESAKSIANNVVEVVRCRDCNTYLRSGCPDGYGACIAMEVCNAVVPDDFFCKYGERRKPNDG